MTIYDLIPNFAALAIAVSLSTFVIQISVARKQRETLKRQTDGSFYISRTSSYETALFQCPTALKFYGIDVDAVESEGLEAKEVIFFILSVNAMVGYCKSHGLSISDHIESSDFRQRMFSQCRSHSAWRFARLAFSHEARFPIDEFMRKAFDVTFDEIGKSNQSPETRPTSRPVSA